MYLLETNPSCCAQQTCTKDGTIDKQMEWDEADRSEETFPDSKSDEAKTPDDDHRNYRWRLPFISLVGCKTEGE